MSDPNGDDDGNEEVGGDVQSAGASLAVKQRATRLKQAVTFAGGARPVAVKAGMPAPTLHNYLSGRDMKASALVDLAGACGVSLEWLATGRGEMLSAAQRQVMGMLTQELATDGTGLVHTPAYRQILEKNAEMAPRTMPNRPRPPSSIDHERLQLAMDMLKAADGDAVLLGEEAAKKIAAVYDVLMGAKS